MVMGEDVLRLRSRGQSAPPLSDEALARACAGGDPGAVSALFDRFRGPVARTIYRLVGGGSDVEDLVQSTFLEVARGKSVWDGRASVLTWLLAIATNVVRHHRRATGRRLRLVSAMTWAQAQERGSGRPEARIELARADKALADLGDELREAFVLCQLEGLSAREAAQALGTSEAAVWVRVSKARKAIRAAVLGDER
jgi:RNA polymerase sigma-70 factor (ECF subfamily)